MESSPGHPQLSVERDGAVTLLRPLTSAAEAWLRVILNLEDSQRIRGAYPVEPQYVPELLETLSEADLAFVPEGTQTTEPSPTAQDILEGAIARLHDATQGDWSKFDDGAAKILFRARYHLQQQTCGDN